LVIVVLRLVQLTVAARERYRLIDDDIRGTEAVVHGRDVDERLERRARLAARLNGAVEVALVPVTPADQGPQVPVARIDRDQGALEVRRPHGQALRIRRGRAIVGSRSLEHTVGIERGQLALERALGPD